MKALGYQRFGPASDVLELRDLATPDPSEGEALVEMHLSGVNPSDVKARAGARPGVTEPPFPFVVPHSDGAGVIVAVGAGVDPARIGQRVWIWNGQWQRAFGTCATHICLPAAQAVPMPDEVPMEVGAQLGIPGLTAVQALFAGGDVAGKRVLVQGAAGTVGYLAAQMAVQGGADVIATARGTGLERAEATGAQTVLDYSAGDLSAQILDAGGEVDHIIEVEFGLNADTDATVVKANGSIASFGSAKMMRPEIPFYPLMFKAVTLHLLLIYLLPEKTRKAAIDRLHGVLATGKIDAPVAATYPLSETAKAHEAVESGNRVGAVLIACQ